MSDVADMLGLAKGPAPATASEEAVKIMGDIKPKPTGKFKKPKGMSREVFDLLGKDGLLSSIQGNLTAPNFKNKRANALKGKWVWAPIASTARTHNASCFMHWSKADSHGDHPYAKFNVRLEGFEYSQEEYTAHLGDAEWTREETDKLVEAAHRYDLRWAVVADRVGGRAVEELQARYFSVRAKLAATRTGQGQGTGVGAALSSELAGASVGASVGAGASATSSASSSASAGPLGTADPSGFNLAMERKRRRQQDMLFTKTKEDEEEELGLREELRAIDAALKKNKKQKLAQTAPVKSEAKPAPLPVSAAALGKTILGIVPTGKMPPAEGPAPGRPCLQSTRLFSLHVSTGAGGSSSSSDPSASAGGGGGGGGGAGGDGGTYASAGAGAGAGSSSSGAGGAGGGVKAEGLGQVQEVGVTFSDNVGAQLTRKMLNKMNLYLREMDIPETPLPTRSVCDLVDQVKRGTVTLLSLHTLIAKKRAELAALEAGVEEVLGEAPKSRAVARSGGARKRKAEPKKGVKAEEEEEEEGAERGMEGIEEGGVEEEDEMMDTYEGEGGIGLGFDALGGGDMDLVMLE